MASVQRRGKNQYLCRWREHPGAPERSRMFRLEREAKNFRDQVAADIARGSYVDPTKGRKILFGEYAEEWFKVQPWRGATYSKQYTNYQNHIAPQYASRPIGQIKTSELRSWATGLSKLDSVDKAEPLAVTTRRAILALLSSIMMAAVEDQVIGRNPASAVRLPTPDSALLVPLTVDQVRELAAAAPKRLSAAVILAAATGLRQGELFGLTEDRIHWLKREISIDRQLITPNKGQVSFGPPKSKRSVRDVPVADHAIEAIAQHVERYGYGTDGLLFTNSSMNPWRRNAAGATFKKFTTSAGLDVSGWHALRHHAASIFIAQGLSVTAVAATLGHSPEECLRTYAHWWPNEGEQIRAAMTRAWADPETPTLSAVK